MALVGLAAGELFNHNEQHCHDVSIWGEVSYQNENCEKCETQFEQVMMVIGKILFKDLRVWALGFLDFVQGNVFFNPKVLPQTPGFAAAVTPKLC
jgi:hypothetical protein